MSCQNLKWIKTRFFETLVCLTIANNLEVRSRRIICQMSIFASRNNENKKLFSPLSSSVPPHSVILRWQNSSLIIFLILIYEFSWYRY